MSLSFAMKMKLTPMRVTEDVQVGPETVHSVGGGTADAPIRDEHLHSPRREGAL